MIQVINKSVSRKKNCSQFGWLFSEVVCHYGVVGVFFVLFWVLGFLYVFFCCFSSLAFSSWSLKAGWVC